jgi:hypothetical protein
MAPPPAFRSATFWFSAQTQSGAARIGAITALGCAAGSRPIAAGCTIWTRGPTRASQAPTFGEARLCLSVVEPR